MEHPAKDQCQRPRSILDDALYHVRLISYDSQIYAESLKTPPLCPSAPLPLCGLNDKSLTGHDIIRW